jgi:hypothetical protein
MPVINFKINLDYGWFSSIKRDKIVLLKKESKHYNNYFDSILILRDRFLIY